MAGGGTQTSPEAERHGGGKGKVEVAEVLAGLVTRTEEQRARQQGGREDAGEFPGGKVQGEGGERGGGDHQYVEHRHRAETQGERGGEQAKRGDGGFPHQVHARGVVHVMRKQQWQMVREGEGPPVEEPDEGQRILAVTEIGEIGPSARGCVKQPAGRQEQQANRRVAQKFQAWGGLVAHLPFLNHRLGLPTTAGIWHSPVIGVD